MISGAGIGDLVRAGKPTKQRPETDVRFCARCGTPLARDNEDEYCSPCRLRIDGQHTRARKEVMGSIDVEQLTREANEATKEAKRHG